MCPLPCTWRRPTGCRPAFATPIKTSAPIDGKLILSGVSLDIFFLSRPKLLLFLFTAQISGSSLAKGRKKASARKFDTQADSIGLSEASKSVTQKFDDATIQEKRGKEAPPQKKPLKCQPSFFFFRPVKMWQKSNLYAPVFISGCFWP